jgi:hypothetical protein
MKPYNDPTTQEKLKYIDLYPEEVKRDEDWVVRLGAQVYFAVKNIK